MTNKTRELIIYPDKVTMCLIAVSCLMFLIPSFLCGMYCHTNKSSLVISGLIVTAILFFGGGFAYAVHGLVLRKPLLIINNEGLFDNTSPFGMGMIEWDEIAEIVPCDMGGPYLGIVPKDTKAIAQRQGLMNKVIMKINSLLFQVPIFVVGNVLPVSIGEVLLEISKHSGVKIRNK